MPTKNHYRALHGIGMLHADSNLVLSDMSLEHPPCSAAIERSFYSRKAVVIDEAIDLGPNVQISPDKTRTIRNHLNWEPNGLYVGVPARRIRDLPTHEDAVE